MVKRYDASADKHTMYGQNNERTFFADIEATDKITLKWNESTNGSFSNTSFLAYDSLIIISDLSGRLTVLQLSDGKKIAEMKYSGSIEQAPVLFNTFLLIIVNEEKETYSTLIIYDIVNGKEVRSLKLKGKFGNELILTDEYLFAISDFGIVYKIAPWGNIEWEKDLSIITYSNPTADIDNIYIPTVKGEIIKISQENGEIVSKYKVSKGFESGLCMNEGNLFIGDIEGIFYSINKANGIINWTFESGYKIVQTPGVDNNFVYTGNLNGDLFSIDKKSGEVNWKYESNGLITASPLIFENILFQPNMLKSFEILDISTGNLVTKINFDLKCRTTPLFYKNHILIGLDKGDIYCYSLNDGKEEK